MKLIHFKYLFVLVVASSLFLTSCSNSTDPLSKTDTESLQKIEYTPTTAEAQTQVQGLLTESFKTILEGSVESNQSLALNKSNSNSTYAYISGWHTWRGDLQESPFDIQNSYNAEYLGKIQFQDASNNVQMLPEDAKYMLIYLNAHAALGFIGNDPSGDEVWYNFEGAVTPLTGNPSMINSQGTYERRWVGEYSPDGENWTLTEIQNKYMVKMSNVKFYYNYVANDYYLSGKVVVTNNGIKIVAKFNNSRTAKLEIYQNGVMVNTAQFELPNFYQIFNIPSLNSWNFGSSFTFPILPTF